MEQEVVIDSTKKLRLSYLRELNALITQARLERSIAYLGAADQTINNFLFTIKDMHPAANEIQTAFDDAMKEKTKKMEEQEKESNNELSEQKINTWEFREMMNNAEINLTINEYTHRTESLWQISLKHSLVPE